MLAVWLPLINGDRNNLGLIDIGTATTNASIVSGKLGNCYQFTRASHHLLIYTLPTELLDKINNHSFGVAAWVKSSSSNAGVWLCITYGMRFDCNSFSLYNSSRSVSALASSGTASDGNWHHIAYTYDVNTNKMTCYRDGREVGSANYTSGYTYASSWTNNINIARDPNNSPDSYYFNGCIQDVRIWCDECPTITQIKEISKGLILHYPLNDSATALKSRSTNVTYNLLVNLNSNGYTYTFASNNSSYYTQIANLNTLITTVSGHKYYTRAYISRNISGNNSVYYQLVTPEGGKAIGTGLANGAPDGYCSNIVTLTGATSNSTYLGIGNYNQKHHFDAGDTVTLKDIVCIDLTTMFGAGNEPTKEEFEELNLHMLTAYNAGTTMNLKEPVYDSSGYNNNGTIIGTLTTSTDTPRYNTSTVLDAKNNQTYKVETDPNWCSDNIISVSFWVKATKTDNQVFFASPHIACGTYNSYMIINPSTAGSYNKFNMTNFVTNTWNHIVTIRNGNTFSLYINGIAETTISSTDSWSHTNGKLWLYNKSTQTYGSNAPLSDFRIYATALSEDDIKDLYQEAAFIDHEGNVGCYLFYEDADSQITKTGQIRTEEFKEVSKNLFNKDEVAFNSYNYGSVPNAFTMISYTGKCTPAKSIPIKPNTWYVLSYDETTVTINYQAFNTTWWDITGKVKVAEDASGGSLGFYNKVKLKSPANAYFVSFSNFGSLSDADLQILVNSLQLEEGEAFTSYEPHFIDVAAVYNNKIECNQLIEI